VGLHFVDALVPFLVVEVDPAASKAVRIFSACGKPRETTAPTSPVSVAVAAV
jgi:hypothetical protein